MNVYWELRKRYAFNFLAGATAWIAVKFISLENTGSWGWGCWKSSFLSERLSSSLDFLRQKCRGVFAVGHWTYFKFSAHSRLTHSKPWLLLAWQIYFFYNQGYRTGSKSKEILENVSKCKKKKKDATSHPIEWLLSKRKKKITGVSKDVKKLEPWCTLLTGMEHGAAAVKNSVAFLKNSNMRLLYDPTTPLLDMYSKELESVTRGDRR